MVCSKTPLDLNARSTAQVASYQEKDEGPSARERADAQLLQAAFLPGALPHNDTLDVARDLPPGCSRCPGGRLV